MDRSIKIELAPEEWGQVMVVLQGGVYRVVAPILQKISDQIQQSQIAQMQSHSARIGLVEDNDVSNPMPAAE